MNILIYKKKANFYHQNGFKVQLILLSKKRFYKKSVYYTTVVGMTGLELYLNECPTRNSKEFTSEHQPLFHYCTSGEMVPGFNLH